uniref:Uncharacterized protein n=1 Tax=Arundo donax TaxID=35708 RepID=A0A0A9DQ18_ARUDO
MKALSRSFLSRPIMRALKVLILMAGSTSSQCTEFHMDCLLFSSFLIVECILSVRIFRRDDVSPCAIRVLTSLYIFSA